MSVKQKINRIRKNKKYAEAYEKFKKNNSEYIYIELVNIAFELKSENFTFILTDKHKTPVINTDILKSEHTYQNYKNKIICFSNIEQKKASKEANAIGNFYSSNKNIYFVKTGSTTGGQGPTFSSLSCSSVIINTLTPITISGSNIPYTSGGDNSCKVYVSNSSVDGTVGSSSSLTFNFNAVSSPLTYTISKIVISNLSYSTSLTFTS